MRTLAWHNLTDHLISQGTTWFTTAAAADLVGGSLAAVYQGFQRLVCKGEAFSPVQGFYVPIPPEYRAWAARSPLPSSSTR